MEECKEVIQQLKRENTTRSISLKSLSPDSLLTLLTDIKECQVGGLFIQNTCFDSDCVNELVQIVTYSKTMADLRLYSSPLLPDTYHFLTTAISSNNKLKSLHFYYDNNLTDNEIPHICDLIINNKKLEDLHLTNCPNITKFGIKQIESILVNNNSLKVLYINGTYLRYY